MSFASSSSSSSGRSKGGGGSGPSANPEGERQPALLTFTADELTALGFRRGAGGQWYRYTPKFGNGDPGDNHVHLICSLHGGRYVIREIELKLRLAGRPIARVFLVRLFDGTFALPINPPAVLNGAERGVASRMYNRLSDQLVALPQNSTLDTSAEFDPASLPAEGRADGSKSWRK